MNRVLSVLKTVYETFGASHPKSSLIVVTVLGAFLGAIVFFSAWRLGENEYRKERSAATTPSQPTLINTGPVNTSGPESPAISGSGNSVQYGTGTKAK